MKQIQTTHYGHRQELQKSSIVDKGIGKTRPRVLSTQHKRVNQALNLKIFRPMSPEFIFFNSLLTATSEISL